MSDEKQCPTCGHVIEKKIKAKIKYGEHVYLTDSELEKFADKLGTETINRCIEKLDAWIASDPTPKRIKNGKNAAACFRSWVINTVKEEQARAVKINGVPKQTNAEKILQMGRELEEEDKCNLLKLPS